MTHTCARCGLFHPSSMPCLAVSLPSTTVAEGLTAGAMLAGRYRIMRTLHRGGMSMVYLAEDTLLQRRSVVLKELRLPPGATPEEHHEAEAWFARESYLLSSLRSPLIPAFYSVFHEAGFSYIVQEYVAGENLNEVVARRGPLDETLVIGWGAALCDLLTYLHDQHNPVVYRDLKPANIVLCDVAPGSPRDECPLKVVDFGIARPFRQGEVGTVIGTPGYAPPEQYQGLATPQSDVYALGATLHRLVTGYDPEHATPFTFPVARSLNPLISPELSAIIERAVRLDPGARFDSAAVMGAALQSLAWQRRQGVSGTAGPSYRSSYARASRSSRWVRLFACTMMLAPAVLVGLHSVLDQPVGGFDRFGVQPGMVQLSLQDNQGSFVVPDSMCGAADSDGAGGPYPAAQSTDCTDMRAVEVDIIPDPKTTAGFEPSNITISRGTRVTFFWQTGGHNLAPFHSTIEPAGFLTSVIFDKPGTYPYSCQVHPGMRGIIHVQ